MNTPGPLIPGGASIARRPRSVLNELIRVFALLARLPALGARYRHPEAPPNIRRLLMRSTRTHVYYSFGRSARVVVIRAIWHASRGHSPFEMGVALSCRSSTGGVSIT
jgi:hypothetical protein